MAHHSPIVRAIDIGYGNTKLTTGHPVGQDISCKMFPSLAPHASANGDLGAGMLAKRETVKIEVAGVHYEVGPDAELAQSGIARNRVLLTDYCKSDSYMALLRGAMSFMGVNRIDLLALGLPVSTYSTHKNDLIELAAGSHHCGNRTVHVQNVRVYPQPLGGFFDFSVRSKLFAQMSTEINLLIDPGFFTLDWLVTSGIKTLEGRSGAANDGGMSSILRAMSKAIAKDYKCDETELGDVERIDSALRNNTNMRLFGETIDVKKYLPIGMSKAEEAINAMMTTIGRTGDIANIVLVEGGSSLYAEAIKARFPKHKIALAHDPVFANARGFQLIAEQRVQQILTTSVAA
jgi:plasmid segregation protein ParM